MGQVLLDLRDLMGLLEPRDLMGFLIFLGTYACFPGTTCCSKNSAILSVLDRGTQRDTERQREKEGDRGRQR